MGSSKREKIIPHANNSQSEARLKAMIALAKSEPEIPISIEELDNNPYLFNCKNGIVNLKSGSFNPHMKEDYITKQNNVKYNPEAACPIWNNFLKIIMNNNQYMIGYLQQIVGYSLTGDTKEQCMFIFTGTGANGKSTFLETVKSLMTEYSASASTSTFMQKQFASIPNDLAALKGKRIVSTSEPDKGFKLSESTVKQLTGSDTITARFLQQEFFDYKPEFKIFMLTNYLPQINGTDYGIWRRIRVIPFEISIPQEQQDKDLFNKLQSELSGILNWAIKGCLEWQKYGLQTPNKVKIHTKSYKNDMDIISNFITDCCYIDKTMKITKGDLYSAYTQWCIDNKYEAEGKNSLSKHLITKGYKDDRNSKARYWIGLSLI